MQKFLLTILFLIQSSLLIFAQYYPGAKQISLANSDVGRANDVFSIFTNPGGIAQMDHREIGVYYSPAPFGFRELANGFIAYNETFSFGSAGLGVMYYGFELYNETRIIAVFSHNYENKFYAGASANYHRVTIRNYGCTATFYADVGGILHLTDYLHWGFCIHNLNHASFGFYDDQIPVILDSGISIEILNNLIFNAALEKDIRYNASIMFGIDFRIVKYLSIRSGFSNEPSRYTAGIGIHYSFVNFDYAVFTHSDLGLTHQAGLIISFNADNSANDKTGDTLGIMQK